MKLSEDRKGLSDSEVLERRARFGENRLAEEKKTSLLSVLLKFFSEPVFLLLIGAACIYFFLGEPRDGIMMLVFVAFMGGVNLYQEWKTDKTLEALKSLSSPKVTVIRNGLKTAVTSEELVPDDLMLLSEGERISADAEIIEADGFGVDESTLTGEADIVWKVNAPAECSGSWRTDCCYAGTNVVSGRAAARVTATGTSTEYGRIGLDVAEAPDRPTPLEKQTRRLVRDCSVFSLILLIFVVLATYRTGSGFIGAALAGITIAMATIPEEFPVVLTVFLALGAWRLARRNALIRRIPSVETLGAVTVLCVDKTGTLTENRMSLRELKAVGAKSERLLETAVLACETNPYDPMEMALLVEAQRRGTDVQALQRQKLLHEFPFSSESRMMAHIWEIEGQPAVAAKGSPENIFSLCDMTTEERSAAEAEQLRLANAGCRVLAVASCRDLTEIPEKLADCHLKLSGLAAFVDPPRENAAESIRACSRAGIRVVMITGDNSATAHKIAHEVGLGESDQEHVMITGDELEKLDTAS